MKSLRLGMPPKPPTRQSRGQSQTGSANVSTSEFFNGEVSHSEGDVGDASGHDHTCTVASAVTSAPASGQALTVMLWALLPAAYAGMHKLVRRVLHHLLYRPPQCMHPARLLRFAAVLFLHPGT